MLKFLSAIACAISVHVCEAAPSVIQLTTTNTVNFRGEVSGQSVVKAMKELSQLVEERGRRNYPIYLVLDSPGGSIMAGDMLVQYLRTLQNVHTISIFAASMAAGIMQANPGMRYITNSGIVMFHRASGSFEGQFNTGELESQLKVFSAFVTLMEQDNADRMGITLQEYKQRIINEWWILGQEAIQSKVADAVVQLRCTSALIEKTSLVTESNFFSSVTITYSECPLFRAPISVEE